jgi:chromosome segregation ATPase
MTDTDKILQALERLEAGQQTMQKDIKSLQVGQQTLQTAVDHQGKTIAGLQDGQMTLEAGQKTLELKVEAFHAEQKTANKGIISVLHEIGEVNAQEAEKRFTRIEKHLNLPPIK